MKKTIFKLTAYALLVVGSLVAGPVELQFTNKTGHPDDYLQIRLAYQNRGAKNAIQYDDREFTDKPFTINIGPDEYSDKITVIDKTGFEKSLVTLGADDTSATFDVVLRTEAMRGKSPIKLVRTDKHNKK